jgi:hypothetical protein
VSASTTAKISDSEGYKDSLKGDFNGSDFGWSIYVGYDFNKYAAVELGWIDLGNPSDVVDKGSESFDGQSYQWKTDIEASLDGMDLAVVGKVPLGESWDLHAKIGVIWWSPDVTWKYTETATGFESYKYTEKYTESSDSTDLLVGVGVSWKLNENIIFGLDWTHMELGSVSSISVDSSVEDVSVSAPIDTTDLYAISATYKF